MGALLARLSTYGTQQPVPGIGISGLFLLMEMSLIEEIR